nr:hypothetical protein HK105_002007 [Polyrhizophydium stewartii]
MSGQPYPAVDKAFVQKLSSSPDPDTILIDVREPSEVAAGIIPTAHNIPVGALDAAFRLSADEFKDTYGFEKPSTDKNVVVYCRSGRRSAAALQVVKSHGFFK